MAPSKASRFVGAHSTSGRPMTAPSSAAARSHSTVAQPRPTSRAGTSHGWRCTASSRIASPALDQVVEAHGGGGPATARRRPRTRAARRAGAAASLSPRPRGGPARPPASSASVTASAVARAPSPRFRQSAARPDRGEVAAPPMSIDRRAIATGSPSTRSRSDRAARARDAGQDVVLERDRRNGRHAERIRRGRARHRRPVPAVGPSCRRPAATMPRSPSA